MKFVFLLVAALSLSNCIYSQNGMSLNIQAIPQLTYLRNKNLQQYTEVKRSERFTTAVGIGAAYGFTRNTGIAADVLYSRQGQRVKFPKYPSTTPTEGATTTLNYIKVPLYFVYNTNPAKTVSFIAKFGPQASFLVSSKFVPDPDVLFFDNFGARYHDITYGLAAGAGAQFNFHQRFYITSNLRSDFDFTNADRGSVPTSHKTRNITAGLELGFKYFLKR